MYNSWNYIPGELILVRCYTNLTSAELLCNGKSIGIKSVDTQTGYISWILPFEEGKLEVIATPISNGESEEIIDTLETTTSSCNIELSLWKNQSSDVISNEYISQIEVTITDTKNRHVVNDSTMLYVKIQGPGELLGLENGDLSDVTEYTANYRRAYEGRLILYIRKTSLDAPLHINVYGDNLKSADIII